MLEVKAGLYTDIDTKADCIPLHGSLSHLRCQLRRNAFDWNEYEASVHAADDLPCPECRLSRQKRMDKGLRPTSIGCLLPDIALLDADHSNGEAIAEIINRDLAARPDVLLVLGTSLRVPDPKKLASMFARVVDQQGGIVVYTNLSKPSLYPWGRLVDYMVESSCDGWVTDLERRPVSTRAALSPLIETIRKQRGKGRRQLERGRKRTVRKQVLGGAKKQDGSADYPLL